MLEKYSFLPRAELLTKRLHCGSRRCCDRARYGNSKSLGNRSRIGSAKIWINIDITEAIPVTRFGNRRSKRASHGRTHFHPDQEPGLPLDHDIQKIFMSISTDTGSFQYPKTSARTFEIAAELVRVGNLDVGEISGDCMRAIPDAAELLRELLRTMRFSEHDRVASFSLSLKPPQSWYSSEDNEGLIDHLRATRSVIVAVFFEELAEVRYAQHAIER